MNPIIESTANVNEPNVHQIDEWFGMVKHLLNVDHVAVREGIASPDVKDFYYDLITSGSFEIRPSEQTIKDKEKFESQVLSKLLIEFFIELHKANILSRVKELYINPIGNKLLPWFVVADNDVDIERNIYLCEGKVNAKNSIFGTTVRSTVVEESDNFHSPNHYIQLVPFTEK